MFQKCDKNAYNDQQWALLMIQIAKCTPATTNSINLQLTTGSALRKIPVRTPTIPIHKYIIHTLLIFNRTDSDTTDTSSRPESNEEIKKAMESISAAVESHNIDHSYICSDSVGTARGKSAHETNTESTTMTSERVTDFDDAPSPTKLTRMDQIK